MKYINLVNFDSLALIMFIQKSIKCVLMVKSMCLRPSSACIIYVGVLFREFIIYLKNFADSQLIEPFQTPILHSHIVLLVK